MGNKDSKQQLYYYLSRKDYQKMKQVLSKNPEIMDLPVTKDTKHNILMRAAFNNDAKAVQFLRDNGANPNIVTPKGETALTIAIRKNSLQIVQMLLKMGAEVNIQNSNGIKPLDLAILQGLLQISRVIYATSNKELRQSFQYEELGKKYQYRYVNYRIFLKLLINEENQQVIGENSYLQKQKPVLFDPVPDPRENWNEWLKRNLDFKDAPMVERSSLPPQMQPQNRKLGKLDIMVHNWVKPDALKKSSYRPKQGRQVMSEMNDLIDNKDKKQRVHEYQSAI